MIQVSAGIVYRDDGKILVCQRGAGRNHAHLWEFPGGKQESGETPAQCLQRELLEELSLPVSCVHELCQREKEGILFTFLEAHTDASPIATEHEAIRFCEPRELLQLPFCPADTEIAAILALKQQPIRVFLWDFDGTLADTYPQMVSYLSAACCDLGIDVSKEYLLQLMKESLPYAIQTLADEFHVSSDQIRDMYEYHNRSYCPEEIVPMDGMIEVLRSLKGQHYLVTHRDISVLRTLKSWGVLDLFSGHMLRGDTGFVRKPCPDGILHLMKDCAINPKEAVMIGDRPLDMQAGRSAGVLTCLFDPESRFVNEPADFHVCDAKRITRILQPSW